MLSDASRRSWRLSFGYTRLCVSGSVQNHPGWRIYSDSSCFQRKIYNAEENIMTRETGERYLCEKCGAELVYKKPCHCPADRTHSEVCCNQQMKKVEGK